MDLTTGRVVTRATRTPCKMTRLVIQKVEKTGFQARDEEHKIFQSEAQANATGRRQSA